MATLDENNQPIETVTEETPVVIDPKAAPAPAPVAAPVAKKRGYSYVMTAKEVIAASNAPVEEPEPIEEVAEEAEEEPDNDFSLKGSLSKIKNTNAYTTQGLNSVQTLDGINAEDAFNLVGDFNIADRDLSSNIENALKQNAHNEAVKLHENQGIVSQAFGFVAQAAVGEIVLGGIEGVGYLLDWEFFYDKYNGENTERYTNWLSDWATEGKNEIREFAPIHMDPDAGAWDPGSSSWWLSNLVSVASVASIAIPAAGWAKGLGMLAKLGKLAATATKASKLGAKVSKFASGISKSQRAWQVPKAWNWVSKLNEAGINTKSITKGANTLNTAVTSRQIENMMEAAGVQREGAEELMATGNYTQEEADKHAADGAALTYNAGWAMLGQDILQWAMLGKTRGFFKATKSPKAIAAQAASLGKDLSKTQKFLGNLKYTGTSYGKQMAGEFGEEYYQFVIAEEGSHAVRVSAGLEEEGNFEDRLGEYLTSSEGYVAGFFGAIGGGLFQAVGPGLGRLAGRATGNPGGKLDEAQLKMAAINNRSTILMDLNKRLTDAAELDDDAAYQVVKDDIAFELAYNGASYDNAGLDIDFFEQIEKMSVEEANELGFDPNFKEEITKYKERYIEAATILQKNTALYTANTSGPISHLEYRINRYTENLPELKKNIDKELADLTILKQLSTEGRAIFDGMLSTSGKERFIANLEHQLNDKKTKISKEDRASIEKTVAEAKSEVLNERQVLEEMYNKGKGTLNVIDEQVVAGDSKYIELLSGMFSTLKHTEHAVSFSSEKMVRMASKDGQTKAETLLKQQVLAQKKADEGRKAKEKEEKRARKGKPKEGMSGEDLAKGVAAGTIDKTKLDGAETERLNAFNNKTNETGNPAEKASAKREEKEENITDKHTLAGKISRSEGLSPAEEAMYTENKEEIDAMAKTMDNSPPPAPKPPTGTESTDGEKKDLENVAQALAHDIQETPDNDEGASTVDVDGNPIVKAEAQVFDDMVSKLAWKSVNNGRASSDNKKDAALIALTDFLEGPYSVEGIYFILEVDTKSDRWGKKAGKKWKAMQAAFARGEVPTNVGVLPVRAVMYYKNGDKVIHNGQELSMHIHDDDFKRKSNAEWTTPKNKWIERLIKNEGGEYEAANNINDAHIQEVLAIKTAAVRAQIEGKRVRLEIDTKTRGNIKVDKHGKNELPVRNNPSDVIVDAVGSEWVYGHSGMYLGRKDGKGSSNMDLAGFMSSVPGAIYISTTAANGEPFPLRLHVGKLSATEAQLAYELIRDLVTEDVYNSPISIDLQERIRTNKNPIISGLYTYLELGTKDITHGKLLDQLVFNGEKQTKGKKQAQLYIKSEGGSTLLIGENGSYSAGVIESEEVKKAIIAHLIEFRNRQIDVNQLNNPKYKQYLMDTGIVATNTSVTKNRRPFVQPSVTYKDPSIEGESTPARKKASDIQERLDSRVTRARAQLAEATTVEEKGKIIAKYKINKDVASESGVSVNKEDAAEFERVEKELAAEGYTINSVKRGDVVPEGKNIDLEDGENKSKEAEGLPQEFTKRVVIKVAEPEIILNGKQVQKATVKTEVVAKTVADLELDVKREQKVNAIRKKMGREVDTSFIESIEKRIAEIKAATPASNKEALEAKAEALKTIKFNEDRLNNNVEAIANLYAELNTLPIKSDKRAKVLDKIDELEKQTLSKIEKANAKAAIKAARSRIEKIDVELNESTPETTPTSRKLNNLKGFLVDNIADLAEAKESEFSSPELISLIEKNIASLKKDIKAEEIKLEKEAELKEKEVTGPKADLAQEQASITRLKNKLATPGISANERIMAEASLKAAENRLKEIEKAISGETAPKGRGNGVKEILRLASKGTITPDFNLHWKGSRVSEMFAAHGVSLEEAKEAVGSTVGKVQEWFKRGVEHLEKNEETASKKPAPVVKDTVDPKVTKIEKDRKAALALIPDIAVFDPETDSQVTAAEEIPKLFNTLEGVEDLEQYIKEWGYDKVVDFIETVFAGYHPTDFPGVNKHGVKAAIEYYRNNLERKKSGTKKDTRKIEKVNAKFDRKLAALKKQQQQASDLEALVETSEVETKSAFEILEDTGQEFNGNSLEILVSREAEKGISEQDVAQALINASNASDGKYDVGEMLHAIKVLQPKVGKKIDLSNSTLGEKKKVKLYNDALAALNKPTQQAGGVEVHKESSLNTLVSSWLQTEEGSLENQTAEESASKFAREYNKRNPVTKGDGRSVAQIKEDDKKLSRKEREDNAGQIGEDIFNTIAQGMSVRETVLNEINDQVLSLQAAQQSAKPDLLSNAESGIQQIALAENASIKARLEALLPEADPDAFESMEEYDAIVEEIKKSKEYQAILSELKAAPVVEGNNPAFEQAKKSELDGIITRKSVKTGKDMFFPLAKGGLKSKYASKQELIDAINAKYKAIYAAESPTAATTTPTPVSNPSIEDANPDVSGEEDPFTDGDGVFSVSRISEENNYSENEAELLRKLLPDAIAIQIHEDYVRILEGGWRAAGVFQNGMIGISRGAQRGTGFHEGFHAVYRTMTTPEQRHQLQMDAKQIFLSPTDNQLASLRSQHPTLNEVQIEALYYEEQMADEFGSYMYGTARNLNIPKKFPPGIRGLFSKLWTWVKSVFNNPVTVDKLFNDIKMGKYRNAKVSLTRELAFKAYRHYRPSAITEVTSNLVQMALKNVKSTEDIDQIDLGMIKTQLEIYTAQGKNKIKAFTAIIDNPDSTAGAVKNAEAGIARYTELIGRLSAIHSEIYDEGDSFWIDKVKEYLTGMGLKPSKGQKIDEDNKVEDSEGNAIMIPKGYEHSGKDNASADVKLLIALTNKTEYNDKGDIVFESSGFLKGLPKKADFSTLWNKIENSLAGITSYVGENGEMNDSYLLMINKLKEVGQFHPELLSIAKRLKNMDEIVQSQFTAIFSRTKGNYTDHVFSGIGGKPVSKIIFADNFTKQAMLVEEWGDTFMKNFSSTPNAVLEYDKAKLDILAANIFKFQKTVTDYVASTKKNNIAKQGTLRNKALIAQRQLFSSLGVRMTDNALSKVLTLFPDGGKEGFEAEALRLKELSVRIVDATSVLRNLDGEVDLDSNPLVNETFFSEIAEIQSEFSPISGESMRAVSGGKQAWVFQDNNSITKTIQRIKDGDFTFLKELLGTPFGTNSLLAHALLNDPVARQQIQTALYGNVREDENADKGDTAANLKSPDQLHDVINKYLVGFSAAKGGKGMAVGLAEADKGQQWYLDGVTVTDSLIVGDDNGENLVLAADAPIVGIFAGYLADEFNRWKVAALSVQDEDQKLLRYKENAQGSYLFPNVDFSKLGVLDENGVPLLTTKEDVWADKGLANIIRDTLLERVEADIAEALRLGVIKTDTAGRLQNRTISTSVLDNKQTIQGQTHGARVTNAIANYTVNSMISNIEWTKVFTGDPALYKKKGDGFADFRKRVPTASGIDSRVFKNKDGLSWAVRPHYYSATVNDIIMPSEALATENADGTTSEFTKKVMKATGMTEAKVKALFAPYKEVNRTDAQAWISLDLYKERLRAWGKWTSGHEDAYQRILAGEILPLDVKLLAMPLKTAHNGLELVDGGVMSRQFNKQSEAPLIPGIHDLTPLKGLMDAMKRDKTGHVITLDGKKAGSIGTTDVTNGNYQPGTEGVKLNPMKLSYSNLYLQQDLSSKGVQDTLLGVQTTKNVMLTVTPERIYSDGQTGIALLEDFNLTISRLSNMGLKSYHERIGYSPEGRTIDDGLLRAALIEDFKSDQKGVSDNIIDALEKGLPLDGMQNKGVIQNRINAMVTKETVKLKQSGGAFVQMSDFGVMGMEVNLKDPVKNGIIFFKDPTEELAPMTLVENEKGELESKPAQILLPHGPLLKLLQKAIDKKYGKGKKTYKDLSHNEINELVDKDAIRGVMYRIPNQGPSSNDAFEIAGILPPEMGDTIIAYSEITTKTGSDFDIDKAFVILPNFTFDSITGKITAVSINNTSKEGLQNRRLSLMSKMLLHPEAYAQVMTPLDADWLENKINALFPDATSIGNLEFFTGTHQLATKSSFDNAKALVGIIANHMVHYAVSVHDNVKYTAAALGVGVVTSRVSVSDGKTKKRDVSSISVLKDVDGYPVEQALGAYMNAIVDAANNPFISKANVNMFTANVVFMITRAGASRDFVLGFTGQPILKEYVELSGISEGRISEDVYENGKKVTPLDTILEKYGYKIPLKYIGQGYSLGQVFRMTAINLKDKSGKVTISNETLKDNIKGEKELVDQIKVLGQFIEWQAQARDLGDLMRVSKADVNGATKNLVSAGIAAREMANVIGRGKFTNLDVFLGYSIVDVMDTTELPSISAVKEETINVYWGQAESDSSTKVLSNLAPRIFTWQNKEYGSVEHAYQSNKSGEFDQSTYDKYIKAGGHGVKIRGKGTVAEMKAADSLGLMKQLVVESFKQNPNSEATKKLMQYENFTHNTNQLIDQAFLEGLKLAQQKIVKVFEGIDNTTPESGNIVTEVKDVFSVTPIQKADTKAKAKAKIATQYIGFAEGINGSSTAAYAKQAGEFANTGEYTSSDVIFVSIGGKRGDVNTRKTQQDKTIKEAIKAIESGATILTDNKSYIESSSYNEGEKRLHDNMKAKGYNYSEVTVDGQTLGTWSNTELPSMPTVKEGVSEVFKDNPELAEIGTEQEYSDYLATIYPDSKVDDIVYHGSSEKETILKEGFKSESSTFFFSDKGTAWDYGFELIEEEGKEPIGKANVIPALVNIELIKSATGGVNTGSAAIVLKENKGVKNLGIREWEQGSGEHFNTVVFSSEQIHILGSKKDISGFKEYNKTSESVTSVKTPLETKVDIAKQNKGKTVTVQYDKYSSSFQAEVTGEVQEVLSATEITHDDGTVTYEDDAIHGIQIKTTTGKILTASLSEITGLDKKSNITEESYKGLKVINTTDIVNKEGKKGAAQYDRANGVIKVDREFLKKKYKEKAWTNPRELKQIIDGEQVLAKSEAIPEDAFKTYEEFETFVMEHERQHDIYTRKDYDADNTEAPTHVAGYETETNNRAFLALEDDAREAAKVPMATSRGTIIWNDTKMLGTYFKNSVLAIREAMKDTFISETNAMEESMLNIATNQGLKIDSTQQGEALADTIMNSLFTALNDVKGNPYHVGQNELVGILTGNKEGKLPIGVRVLKARDALKDNTFVSNLSVSSGAIRVPYSSMKNTSTDAQNSMYLDWMHLKEYEADPTLWKDLMVVSFYTSGLQKGFGTFNEHVPTDFLLEGGYMDFWSTVQTDTANSSFLEDAEDKVIRHLWKRNDIVPSFSTKETLPVRIDGKEMSTERIFKANPAKSAHLEIGMNARGVKEYKRFVKIIIHDAVTGEADWALFKLAGYSGLENKKTPVYVRTNKKGRYKKGLKIYEYFKKGDTSMFPENKLKPDETTPAINDYLSGLSLLPEPVIKNLVLKNEFIDSSEPMTPERKEELLQEKKVCFAGKK